VKFDFSLFILFFTVAQSLTKGGGGGAGGGFDGFVSLLGGLGGGGAGNSDNILTVLVGLAKSFFAMQVGVKYFVILLVLYYIRKVCLKSGFGY
jgi:hypothetical protein